MFSTWRRLIRWTDDVDAMWRGVWALYQMGEYKLAAQSLAPLVPSSSMVLPAVRLADMLTTGDRMLRRLMRHAPGAVVYPGVANAFGFEHSFALAAHIYLGTPAPKPPPPPKMHHDGGPFR